MEKKKLSIDDKRSCIMTTKVTAEEREEIRNTASACGMTTSDFTRHRNLGYNPTATLSKEELEGLNNLGLCRTDLVNYWNAFSLMDEESKIQMFKKASNMMEWFMYLQPIIQGAAEYLYSVRNTGRISKKTVKTLKQLMKDGGKG